MIVDTLQSAFQDDMLFKYIMSDSLYGIDALRWYFTEAITHPHSEIVQSQNAEAVLVWIPGEAFPPKFTQDPPKQFTEVLSRMELHEASPEGYIAKNGVRYAYLWLLGVHNDHRGKSLASKLMRQACTSMKEKGFDSCWLSTENAKNIPMYQHFGFELMHEMVSDAQLQTYIFRKKLT